jgi:DNA-3-methyladenine glycosylase
MRRIIKAKELRTENTVALARGLLGKHLVRRMVDGEIVARLITEVEAYGEHTQSGKTVKS